MRAIPLRFDRLPRYVLLLVAMLVEVVIAPMIVGREYGLTATRLATAGVLLAALWAVGASRGNIICFFAAIVALLTAALWSNPTVVAGELVLRTIFVGYITAVILWSVLQREQVTFDTIAGAACAYMLLGLVWAPMYMLIEHLRPGSFDIPESWLVGPHRNISPAMVYFSYVTLTTIGFGDIRATDSVGGGLVVVEAVIGQLYLAITVARLVGLHIARPRD